MLRQAASFVFISALIAATIGCTVWGEHKPTAWADITGGESLERVFWHEVQSKHWTELETHLAANFVLVTPDGNFDRTAALDHLKELQVYDFSLAELHSQLNGNTYTVNYILRIRGMINGKPVPTAPLRAMTVWQKQVREEWIMIAHSAMPMSPVNDPRP